MIFNSNQSVGEIVANMPKASEVFKKYRIDFCCGGYKSLKEVLAELQLKEEEVLEALEQTYAQMQAITHPEIDFKEMKSSELIEYIVNTHHTYVKRILPELSEFTTKILKVHGPMHKELFKVHTLFHTLKMELEQHLIKEEEILFPMINDYEITPSKELLDQIIEVMKETEDEHEVAGNVLKELRVITDDYTVPTGGCTTYFLTYQKLQELESDLFEHIHLENNILFKDLGILVHELN